MGALTLEVVRGWRPEALAEAAAGVATARDAVESEVRAARASVARLTAVWDGAAASAAADRMAREPATGFALTRTADLADLVVGASVHPDCGSSTGPPVELAGDGTELPREVAEQLGAALLRADVIVRSVDDSDAPLLGLFTGPGGAWTVSARRLSGDASLALPSTDVEVRSRVRSAVEAAIEADGRRLR